MKGTRFDELVEELRAVGTALPDRRTGKNLSYTMADFALSAFAVFFAPSPSFLAHQRAMQTTRGHNNARSFFQIEALPCDNQIRQVLDHVPPESLYPVYDGVYDTLREHGIRERFRGVQDSRLIALDGTWYFSSPKLHCPCCSQLEHKRGEVTCYHSAVTPVRVAPGQPEVIALRPEFITPQDGHRKQDCELAAAKRWLAANATRYGGGAVPLLGDELYAHQPFCRRWGRSRTSTTTRSRPRAIIWNTTSVMARSTFPRCWRGGTCWPSCFIPCWVSATRTIGWYARPCPAARPSSNTSAP